MTANTSATQRAPITVPLSLFLWLLVGFLGMSVVAAGTILFALWMAVS